MQINRAHSDSGEVGLGSSKKECPPIHFVFASSISCETGIMADSFFEVKAAQQRRHLSRRDNKHLKT